MPVPGEGDAVSERITIRWADPGDPDVAKGLADVLVDCVEGGASIGFMLPFGVDRAEAFWAGTLARAARGERIVLVADDREAGTIVGTVQVIFAAPENQPHRGDISKMLVHRRARRQGVGEALMQADETAARKEYTKK